MYKKLLKSKTAFFISALFFSLPAYSSDLKLEQELESKIENLEKIIEEEDSQLEILYKKFSSLQADRIMKFAEQFDGVTEATAGIVKEVRQVADITGQLRNRSGGLMRDMDRYRYEETNVSGGNNGKPGK